MLQNFDLCIQTHFIFGDDSEKRISAELLKRKVKRVLLHHDSGKFLYDSGLLSFITEEIENQGIQVYELGGVQPNPRLELVYRGIEMVKREDIEFVLAIGGGSSIDSAKAIALGAKSHKDVWDFFLGKEMIEAALPVGVVLTYPATGSESSDVSVINHAERGEKRLVSAPAIRPALAFMNPRLSCSLPPSLTAYGIVDMYSHVCERYFTSDAEIGVIDRMSEGILRTLTAVGSRLMEDPDSYECRAQIMWIGTIAHNDTVGIGRTQDWATHVIGNELSALFDTPHGVTLSVLMGSWMRAVYRENPYRFARYAKKVFDVEESEDPEEMARKGILKTEAFFEKLNMPISFTQAGLPVNRMEEVAGKVQFKEDYTIGSIVKLDKEKVMEILNMAKG